MKFGDDLLRKFRERHADVSVGYAGALSSPTFRECVIEI